ncbi:acetamidase [Paraphaeosphaeria sporulosa]|uniref:amidase n=1 Tax=Paraphaeosphaeria sporulosa TaxID=1460663 RepID=A0A177C125_9PLEO|nr:acetamidase [Paraphaeosphaeria sporulosa]OAG01494.1 acetamidase [Paraphaeosphaeria sporulosa]
MAAQPQLPARWQFVAWQKKDEQFARIPPDWRISHDRHPAPNATNFLDIPRKCGILSDEELKITEEYDATALAEAIRARKLKSVDVARAFCKRAAVAHQLTNCLTEIFFEDALKRAKELDDHLESGKPPLGPLHGVPVSLKDTFKVKGYDASIGIAALCFKPSQDNSVLVDILLSGGAVLYCKTNVPQTLAALDSHNNIFGRTLNPLNTAVTAGGSSGGEAALLGMRGSVLGVGTDVGGSIRVPAMCEGLYGAKPSDGRVPYAGQEGGSKPAVAKLGVSASAGPMAHSMRDIELFFKVVSDQKPWELDPDVIPGPWNSLSSLAGRKLRVGVVRRDGVVEPLPPIMRLIEEVALKMRKSGIEVVELDITPIFSKCQSLINALMGVEGGNSMFDLLESFDEPLSPWIQPRMRRKEPVAFEKLRELHAQRLKLQTEALQIWKRVDAFICPVAPHPVPEIDKYNAASYTSSFVLLDYPAGTVPVRLFEKKDEQGDMTKFPVLGSWDKRNRELWSRVDRSVYIGTPLCVQVVAPKLEERRLCEAMVAIDSALKAGEMESYIAKL